MGTSETLTGLGFAGICSDVPAYHVKIAVAEDLWNATGYCCIYLYLYLFIYLYRKDRTTRQSKRDKGFSGSDIFECTVM